LLFFHGVARQRENVAEAGKDETSDAPLVRLEEGDFAFLEREEHVGVAEFDAVVGGESVNGLGIEAKGVERIEKIARRGIGSAGGRGEKEEEKNEAERKAHGGSVVTFGIGEQG